MLLMVLGNIEFLLLHRRSIVFYCESSATASFLPSYSMDAENFAVTSVERGVNYELDRLWLRS
jgi:hypothetical protein